MLPASQGSRWVSWAHRYETQEIQELEVTFWPEASLGCSREGRTVGGNVRCLPSRVLLSLGSMSLGAGTVAEELKCLLLIVRVKWTRRGVEKAQGSTQSVK